jgi:hypothetical protein
MQTVVRRYIGANARTNLHVPAADAAGPFA